MPTMGLEATKLLSECHEFIATQSRPITTICIVGSVERVWNEEEKIQVRDFLFKIIYELMAMDDSLVFISGESPKGGVDIWTKEICTEELGASYKGFPPEQHNWHYYKKRNKLMAHACDILIRVYNARSKTYGSGWTADFAENLGKKVIRVKVW